MEINVTGTVFLELGPKTLALLTGGVTSLQPSVKPEKVQPKEEAPEEVVEEKPKATRSRAAKKEEPKKEEEVKDETPTEEETKDEDKKGNTAVTLDEIRKEQRRVSMAGKIDKMKEALSKFGANAASELDEKNYGEYYELLKAIA